MYVIHNLTPHSIHLHKSTYRFANSVRLEKIFSTVMVPIIALWWPSRVVLIWSVICCGVLPIKCWIASARSSAWFGSPWILIWHTPGGFLYICVLKFEVLFVMFYLLFDFICYLIFIFLFIWYLMSLLFFLPVHLYVK